MKNVLEVIPAEIGKLVHLRELKIDGNRLSRLPLVLNEMPALRTLICEDHLMETLDPQMEKWRMEAQGIYKKLAE